jgi:hypothetical protein
MLAMRPEKIGKFAETDILSGGVGTGFSLKFIPTDLRKTENYLVQ